MTPKKPHRGDFRTGFKRDFDPLTARWTSEDPAGYVDSLNLYAYCGGNPVNWVDGVIALAITLIGVGYFLSRGKR